MSPHATTDIVITVAGLALMSPTLALAAAVDHIERIGCRAELAAGSILSAAVLGGITYGITP